MIDIEYTTSPQESARATLDFLTNRPILAMLVFFMRGACILLCLGFVALAYTHNIRPQDILAVILAVGWILFYKSVNRWLIQRIIKLRKFDNVKCLFRFDDKSILFKAANNTQHIEWKKLRFLLKNPDGYIIPLTGIKNSGKFLWLPERSFDSEANKNDFLNLVQKFKLKVKPI